MNPYTLRSMIRLTEQFIGRSAELNEVYTLIASLQCCSIVGPRRIGKSSLIYHLAQHSIFEACLPDPERYVFAFIDLQELVGLEVEDFFSTAVERLDRASQGQLSIDRERDGTSSGFRRLLGRVTDDGFRIVLCCDEFEMLSQSPQYDADFFTYIRGLCSNYNLAMVTSSRASLYDLCHQGNLQTSQFWNIFTERSLGLMTDDEARCLILTPLARADIAFSEDEIGLILDVAGYHPMFIQIASYHVFAAKSQKNTIETDTLRELFVQEARPHFAYAWNQLSNQEREALLRLADGSADFFDSGTFQRLKRDALVSGSVDEPGLTSGGWQHFLELQMIEYSSQAPPLNGTTVFENARLKQASSTPPGKILSVQFEPEKLGQPYQIGRYRVDATLGRGGFATVMRAHDPTVKRDVAVKILPSQFINDSVYRARFEREAQIIASLEHPAIVPIYDFGEVDEFVYLVMRLMPRGSLADLLREGEIPLASAAQILTRIASALDEAHAQGVVHRDLKPGNVLFDQYGNAYLSDFGIALVSEAEMALTGSGIVGTPSYMSPEQVHGDMPVDGRSDVYSLGIMMFEMLTGQLPFQGITPSRVMMQHLLDPIPDILFTNPNLPQTLKAICDRAMAKQPSHRYATCGALATDLAALIRR